MDYMLDNQRYVCNNNKYIVKFTDFFDSRMELPGHDNRVDIKCLMIEIRSALLMVKYQRKMKMKDTALNPQEKINQ